MDFTSGASATSEPGDEITPGAVFIETEPQSSYMRGFPPPRDRLVDGSSVDWLLDPDKCRWGMLNVSKFLHTAAVSRGEGPIARLPRDDRALVDEDFQDASGNIRPLGEMLRANRVDGFLALKSGKVVMEAYCNGYGPGDRHEMMSVTKCLIGVTIGLLIADGAIEPERPVDYYLPELACSGWAGATVRQVLDMTAGIKWCEDHRIDGAEVMLATAATGLQRPRDDYPFRNGWELIRSITQETEHGVRYAYSSGSSELLGWLATRLCQEPWQNFFARRIWARLGTEHDALIIVDETGQGAAHAGFNASLRDMGRFALMLVQQGRIDDRQILSSSWIDDIVTGDAAVRAAWRRAGENMLFGEKAFYRGQFRVLDSDRGILLGLGSRGQMLYANIAEQLVGIFQSSHAAANEEEGDAHIRLKLGIMEQLGARL